MNNENGSFRSRFKRRNYYPIVVYPEDSRGRNGIFRRFTREGDDKRANLLFRIVVFLLFLNDIFDTYTLIIFQLHLHRHNNTKYRRQNNVNEMKQITSIYFDNCHNRLRVQHHSIQKYNNNYSLQTFWCLC